MFHYEKAWQDVKQRIVRAARAAGRDPASVRLVAVSKTFPAGAVRAVHALGQREFGENYVQEAVAKMEALADLAGIEWHLIGPLQSNKAGIAAARFAWVQTVDRAKIAGRLAAARATDAPPLDVCIQVNASGEASKSGVAPAEALALAKTVAMLPRLQIARHHGHSGSRLSTWSAGARSCARCARASTSAGPRECRSTRCRWGCPPTSRMRSPRARRWCGSGPPYSGRVTPRPHNTWRR